MSPPPNDSPPPDMFTHRTRWGCLFWLAFFLLLGQATAAGRAFGREYIGGPSGEWVGVIAASVIVGAGIGLGARGAVAVARSRRASSGET